MVDFVKKIDELASKYNVSQRSVVYKYIEKRLEHQAEIAKLGVHLAIYMRYMFFVKHIIMGRRAGPPSVLMQRMRALPFGSKLQNHPLDNRLNDEVRRSFLVQDNMLPVQSATEGTVKKNNFY
jgi:hypothetical protein